MCHSRTFWKILRLSFIKFNLLANGIIFAYDCHHTRIVLWLLLHACISTLEWLFGHGLSGRSLGQGPWKSNWALVEFYLLAQWIPQIWRIWNVFLWRGTSKFALGSREPSTKYLHYTKSPGPCLNVKTVLLCIMLDCLIIKPSYRYNRNSYTSKTASLNWDCLLHSVCSILCPGRNAGTGFFITGGNECILFAYAELGQNWVGIRSMLDCPFVAFLLGYPNHSDRCIRLNPRWVGW